MTHQAQFLSIVFPETLTQHFSEQQKCLIVLNECFRFVDGLSLIFTCLIFVRNNL